MYVALLCNAAIEPFVFRDVFQEAVTTAYCHALPLG